MSQSRTTLRRAALGLLALLLSVATTTAPVQASGGRALLPKPGIEAGKTKTKPQMREVLVEDDSGVLRPALRPVEEAVPAGLVITRKGKPGAAATADRTADADAPRGPSDRFDALIAEAAARHGVPLALAHAVIKVESNYNPRARGSAGEVGLMQIKPATARGLGFRGSVRALYDPATNLEWGMRYLAGAHKLASGDTCGTVLRYNAGHFAKRMNPTSKRYCGKVKVILASA
ncbi:transglycosylase SLT domain-containing protein [Microvirga tunisiensis]|uniref:Transglycosylase SLT domain-containing protein n=1 Tax=Pannonibacter tanglangensis TaxID=2750084 RepID=A0ABW9ZJX5_9HYPH|nr:transglycosylase SLT domain-containing protein [Pannonibacter sp. XCT-34]